MDTETVSEEAAAEMLGIRALDVKRLRKKVLAGPGDFVVEGRDVRITPGGLKKIAAAISPGKKEAAPPVEIPHVTLRDLIVDSTCQNPRIVLCHYGEGDFLFKVRCRVRDSRNFTRGMIVPGCRMVQETLYAYEGRMPRTRGRWG